ncbi:Uu.00g125180.m01.CDS01 [Anthostomella pinea]|uniref:Uu.00g125180.m01.CDS01 n=1 Tax=Anthostomella pinea TaxID=933095 RepID=A0AAI8VIS1_9PEZI|nr:Uu.00g125180.m01.CDS01 [Anthostomella pinea]
MAAAVRAVDAHDHSVNSLTARVDLPEDFPKDPQDVVADDLDDINWFPTADDAFGNGEAWDKCVVCAQLAHEWMRQGSGGKDNDQALAFCKGLAICDADHAAKFADMYRDGRFPPEDKWGEIPGEDLLETRDGGDVFLKVLMTFKIRYLFLNRTNLFLDKSHLEKFWDSVGGDML